MKKTLLTSIIVLGCLMALPSLAASVYVDGTSGSNAGAGTEASPYKTITKALTAIVGGDTIACKGIVSDSFTFPVAKSGSAGAPTTITNWGDDTCIVDGGGAAQVIQIANSASYLTINNLNITNGAEYGLMNGYGNSASNITITNNTIYGITAASNDIFMYLNGASDSVVSGNTVFGAGNDTDQFGIWLNNSPGIIAEKNKVYNFSAAAITMDNNSNNSIIKNNLVYNIGGYSGVDRAGIYVLDSHDVNVYNNSLYNIYDATNGMPAINVRELYGPDTYNVIVRNNIISKANYGFVVDAGSILGSNSDYNVFHDTQAVAYASGLYYTTLANWQAAGQDANSLEADPLFISTVSGSENLDITSSSPCINAGTDLADVSDDYNGAIRPQGASTDMGAYEYAAVPANLSASNVKAKKMKISWDSTCSGCTYDLHYATNTDFDKNDGSLENLTITSQVVTGLKTSKKYYFRIKSNNGANESGYSDAFSRRTLPKKGKINKVINKTTDSVTLKCAKIPRIKQMQAKVYVKKGSKWKKVKLVKKTKKLKKKTVKIKISDLETDKSYKAKVRGKWKKKLGVWSKVKRFKPLID